MTVDIAASSYTVQSDAAMEGYVNVFAGNIMALLFSLVKNTGDAGWHKGIWRRSDAVTLRDEKQQTIELEVFQFDVTFEVDYA